MSGGQEERVRRQFGRQGFMRLLGAELTEVRDGEVTVELDAGPQLAQQHGFVHAGVVTSALDTVCGFAALTRMDDGVGVLTAEFKVNLLRPARGPRLVVRAEVVQAGRTLVVCQARARMRQADGGEELVALMTATLASVRGRSDVVD
ncbi:PaaI family thioesterase [Geodermatophilus sp. SYSU D00691]